MGIEIIKGSPRILPGAKIHGNIKDVKVLKNDGASSGDGSDSYIDDGIRTKAGECAVDNDHEDHVNTDLAKFEEPNSAFEKY